MRLQNRIWIKQTGIVFLFAVLFGFSISGVQVYTDLRNERTRAVSTVLQIMTTLKEPAHNAAYTVDQDLAEKVISSLLQFDGIGFAELIDEFGNVLASRERPKNGHPQLADLACSWR